MGLDMYLELVPKDKEPKTAEEYFDKSEAAYESGLDFDEKVAYWRKANAIHNWFCNHCKCLEDQVLYKVTREDVLRLIGTICRVLAASEINPDTNMIKDSSLAEELLPTCNGCFFGSTDYDDWYIDQLEFSIEELGKALGAMEKDTVLFYYASW